MFQEHNFQKIKSYTNLLLMDFLEIVDLQLSYRLPKVA